MTLTDFLRARILSRLASSSATLGTTRSEVVREALRRLVAKARSEG